MADPPQSFTDRRAGKALFFLRKSKLFSGIFEFFSVVTIIFLRSENYTVDICNSLLFYFPAAKYFKEKLGRPTSHHSNIRKFLPRRSKLIRPDFLPTPKNCVFLHFTSLMFNCFTRGPGTPLLSSSPTFLPKKTRVLQKEENKTKIVFYSVLYQYTPCCSGLGVGHNTRHRT